MTVLLAAAIAIFALLFPSSASADPGPSAPAVTKATLRTQVAPRTVTGKANRESESPEDDAPDLDPLDALLGTWDLHLHDVEDAPRDLGFTIECIPTSTGFWDLTGQLESAATDEPGLVVRFGDGPQAPLALARRGDHLWLASSVPFGSEIVQFSACVERGALQGSLFVAESGSLWPWAAERGRAD